MTTAKHNTIRYSSSPIVIFPSQYSYWSSWGMSFWGCNRRKEGDRTVVTIDGYQEVPQNEEALLQVG